MRLRPLLFNGTVPALLLAGRCLPPTQAMDVPKLPPYKDARWPTWETSSTGTKGSSIESPSQQNEQDIDLARVQVTEALEKERSKKREYNQRYRARQKAMREFREGKTAALPSDRRFKNDLPPPEQQTPSQRAIAARRATQRKYVRGRKAEIIRKNNNITRSRVQRLRSKAEELGVPWVSIQGQRVAMTGTRTPSDAARPGRSSSSPGPSRPSPPPVGYSLDLDVRFGRPGQTKPRNKRLAVEGNGSTDVHEPLDAGQLKAHSLDTSPTPSEKAPAIQVPQEEPIFPPPLTFTSPTGRTTYVKELPDLNQAVPEEQEAVQSPSSSAA